MVCPLNGNTAGSPFCKCALAILTNLMLRSRAVSTLDYADGNSSVIGTDISPLILLGIFTALDRTLLIEEEEEEGDYDAEDVKPAPRSLRAHEKEFLQDIEARSRRYNHLAKIRLRTAQVLGTVRGRLTWQVSRASCSRSGQRPGRGRRGSASPFVRIRWSGGGSRRAKRSTARSSSGADQGVRRTRCLVARCARRAHARAAS